PSRLCSFLSCLFFLLLPRPPISTLFPYTTLFRSIILKLPVLGTLMRKIAVARFTRTLGTLISSGVPILEGLDITARTAGNAGNRDRKSTRLNSSHGSISYAVFCLKKKKKNKHKES